jgi:uncharacterized protein
MRPMIQLPGGFRAALWLGWIALGVAGIVFARGNGIPNWAALPLLAALLVEYPFYLVAGFASVRERLHGRTLSLFLIASALLPYLVYSLGTGVFQWSALTRLLALALVLSLWYEVLPPIPVFDLAYLGLLAAVLLGKYFDGIYPSLVRRADAAILGKLALFQIAVLVLILDRRVPPAGYGFVPSRRDWAAGALHYVYFMAVAGPLAFWMHATTYAGVAPLWKVAGTFLGFLWVVALAEEFFFRGVLLHWLEEWTAHPQAALVLCSVLFGLVHLPFRGFPNWRWVLLAGILGYCCGRARNQTGSVRAAVVTHTLVVTTWRAFCS